MLRIHLSVCGVCTCTQGEWVWVNCLCLFWLIDRLTYLPKRLRRSVKLSRHSNFTSSTSSWHHNQGEQQASNQQQQFIRSSPDERIRDNLAAYCLPVGFLLVGVRKVVEPPIFPWPQGYQKWESWGQWNRCLVARTCPPKSNHKAYHRSRSPMIKAIKGMHGMWALYTCRR